MLNRERRQKKREVRQLERKRMTAIADRAAKVRESLLKEKKVEMRLEREEAEHSKGQENEEVRRRN